MSMLPSRDGHREVHNLRWENSDLRSEINMKANEIKALKNEVVEMRDKVILVQDEVGKLEDEKTGLWECLLMVGEALGVVEEDGFKFTVPPMFLNDHVKHIRAMLWYAYAPQHPPHDWWGFADRYFKEYPLPEMEKEKADGTLRQAHHQPERVPGRLR